MVTLSASAEGGEVEGWQEHRKKETPLGQPDGVLCLNARVVYALYNPSLFLTQPPAFCHQNGGQVGGINSQLIHQLIDPSTARLDYSLDSPRRPPIGGGYFGYRSGLDGDRHRCG